MNNLFHDLKGLFLDMNILFQYLNILFLEIGLLFLMRIELFREMNESLIVFKSSGNTKSEIFLM